MAWATRTTGASGSTTTSGRKPFRLSFRIASAAARPRPSLAPAPDPSRSPSRHIPADIKRAGTDITLVAYGPAVPDVLKAAQRLNDESGASAEVIDLRSLVPLDIDTVLNSVRKTGRCVVVSQAVQMGSFTGEIASTVQERAFDYLDAPVIRVGAKNGIAPQSHVLEAVFYPRVEDIVEAAKQIL